MRSPEPRLLVVDDEPLLCELLSVHLGGEGYSVATAPTGEDALTGMREERPDLVLLDLMLPGLSGLDVLTSIRQTRTAHDLPVVVVSAEGGSPAIAEALKRGANDYVTKPFNFSLLAARIATLIDVSMRARDALGSEFHMLQGRALPSAPVPVGWCPRCTSVQTEGADDPSSCVHCGGPEPAEGWRDIERSSHDYLGRVIGGSFFVDQHLGFGAAGVVYRVHDLDMHRVFASKLVRIPQDSAEAVRARVIAEVKALAKVQSPHVVKIVRVARVESDVFALVMDFVDGVTLERLLSEMGRLPVADAIAIARQVAQGLSEAHNHGLVHRDIKPANIMLEPLPAGDYFAKILDFGIVRTDAGPVEGEGFVGTPTYSAPEQIEEDEVQDHRVDIYSLGATLFHLVAGRPPFVANPMATMVQHLTQPAPSLMDLVDDQPGLEAVNEIVQRMLAKDRDERFTSVVDVVHALDRAAEEGRRTMTLQQVG